MKLKTVISAVLLLFVAISIVTLIVKQTSDTPPAITSQQPVTDEQSQNDRLIVYYFHGNKRCPTCNTLEAYSKEAVETCFSAELESGRIEWQVVNYDKPRNEHFLTDYDLSFQSMVLVNMKDGKETGYKNLEEIWDLVWNKQGFITYVQSEIADFYMQNETADFVNTKERE
ncbi:MAG: nitrophenyl compound nitroreductase subunit ArsF family protein [Candidatus Krumholzibacteriota bacterium]|nr:nitrophenyl compound nitroreductase subunit ArsF family protein [Candidatus Krumholzibacteriota bacterium]